MWKQLFNEAPPNAVEHLLTPQRKFLYGMIAFAPGTMLGLYLHSVKKRMDVENEKLRLKHVAEQIEEDTERQQKDALLLEMMNDMRHRIKRLEAEAQLEQRPPAASSTHGSESAGKTDAQVVAKKSGASPPALTPAPESALAPGPAVNDWLLPAQWGERLTAWRGHWETAREKLQTVQDAFADMTASKEAVKKSEEGKQSRELAGTCKNQPSPSSAGGPSGISERIRAQEQAMIAEDVRAYKEARKRQQ